MNIVPLVNWMLHALAEELAAADAGPVGVTLIAPGGRPPPADWCCIPGEAGTAEGMAWVRINRRFPQGASRLTFPTPTLKHCVVPWSVELELGSYRCAATIDDEGRPPAPEAVTADALRMESDAEAILRAICRLRWPYIVDQWSTLGPSGGVVGGAQLVTVELSSGPIGREN